MVILSGNHHKEEKFIMHADFWHERWQNGDQSISNLRVNSSPEALAAYRTGISAPFWLSRPLYEK